MLCVCFRGTASLADVFTDMKFVIDKPESVNEQDEQEGIHAGFKKAYVEVRKRLLEELAKEIIKNEVTEEWRVLVCGHSLGGAIATIAALDIAQAMDAEPKPLPKKLDVLVYTFGQPRTGDADFVHTFNTHPRITHWRVTNDQDLVPKVNLLVKALT